MTDFTTLVTLLATLSVAVERAVEIFKGMVPYLSQTLNPGAAENRRRAVLQIIAVLFGTVAAYLAKGQINAIGAAKWLTDASLHGAGFAIVGFLTAGGSAFWNHILDIIGALKTRQENAANAPPSPAQPAAVASVTAVVAPGAKL
jgi:hypothetical protein